MRIVKIISYFVLLLLPGCKAQKNVIVYAQQEFEYFTTNENFKLELIEFYDNSATCATEGLPYALLIGKTKSPLLPKKVSVLSYCDNNTYKVGDSFVIKPAEPIVANTTLKPIFFVKDTILGKNKMKWIIGSEYPAIWGQPIKIID